VVKRGKHFFRSREDIRDEILEFEQNGGKEVVLTGVNLSAWGLETTNDIHSSRFAELLKYLLQETNIPRLRISSLGPEFIDDKCLEVFKNERIYPHFHYSVQSGSSHVLK
jgi:tRNA A37 methylthiotransferase MiaB